MESVGPNDCTCPKDGDDVKVDFVVLLMNSEASALAQVPRNSGSLFKSDCKNLIASFEG